MTSGVFCLRTRHPALRVRTSVDGGVVYDTLDARARNAVQFAARGRPVPVRK